MTIIIKIAEVEMKIVFHTVPKIKQAKWFVEPNQVYR